MKASSPFPLNPILIVDDETESLRSFAMVLRMQGINHVVECSDSREVMPLLGQGPIDVILLDLTMPFLSGEEILPAVSEQFPEIPVIVVTAMDEVDMAVRCMKMGALDYMVKPVEKSRLVSGVMRAIETRELRDQNRLLKERMLSGELLKPEAFSHIVTRSRNMLSIFQYVESIAQSRQPVLVSGETGVGKELLVKAIHALSAPEGSLVAVNVAGIDDTVFSDTLFGHAKGAYTGAAERRQGLVEKAAGGTLYLDEIGDLSLESQVKLLRLLQEREYFPLGSDTPRTADARVIATTNRDLLKLQESGRFRKDLYYRLSTHQIHIPSLQFRREDIPLLLNHFIGEAARSLKREPPSYPEEILALLFRYDFPGNVREMRTIVYDAVTRNKTGKLSLKELNARFNKGTNTLHALVSRAPYADGCWPPGTEGRLPTIGEATSQLIREALIRCSNNQSEAARLLGISRQRLARHLKNQKT